MPSILYVEFEFQYMKFEESIPYLLLKSIFQKRAPCFFLFNHALVSCLLDYSVLYTHMSLRFQDALMYVIDMSRCN
jgi:hypothetical protein